MKVLRRVTMAQVKKQLQQRQEKLVAEKQQPKGRVLGTTRSYREGFAQIAWRQ